MDLADRFLILVLAALGGWALWKGLGAWTLARATRQAGASGGPPPAGRTLLYFSSPDCAPCRNIQRPAVEALAQTEAGALKVVEINVLDEPGSAARWGVVSLPTTILLDRTGRPKFINHGVVSRTVLHRQLESLQAL